MRRVTGLVLLGLLMVWLGPASSAAADVKINGEVKVQPNRLVRLSVELPVAKGAVIAWDTWPTTIDPVDSTRLGDKFVFVAEPGTYEVRVLVVSTDTDGKQSVERGSVTVVIAKDNPPPEDQFLKSLTKAYQSETAEDKADSKTKLAKLYRQAAADKILMAAKTGKALFSAMADTATALGVGGKLPAVQKAISTELQARLKLTNDQELDDSWRKQIADVFRLVADTLEKVK